MAALLVLGAVFSVAASAGATVVVTDIATAVAYLAFVFMTQLLVCSLALRLIFGTTLLRGTVLWLASTAVAVLTLPILTYLIRPYVLESYVSEDSNAMAPTIISWHANVTCPNCGAAAVVPLRPPHENQFLKRFAKDDNYSRILCSRCWIANQYNETDFVYASPDRFSVDKLATPQRWEVIVHRTAYDPNELHFFRLVGLPGQSHVQTAEKAA